MGKIERWRKSHLRRELHSKIADAARMTLAKHPTADNINISHLLIQLLHCNILRCSIT